MTSGDDDGVDPGILNDFGFVGGAIAKAELAPGMHAAHAVGRSHRAQACPRLLESRDQHRRRVIARADEGNFGTTRRLRLRQCNRGLAQRLLRSFRIAQQDAKRRFLAAYQVVGARRISDIEAV